MALAATMSSAGTLTLQYFANSSECVASPGDVPCSEPWVYSNFSSPASFIFDVSLDSPSFFYADNSKIGVANPNDAWLRFRPDGHFGGYYERDYSIALSSTDVSVLGRMADNDDVFTMTSKYVEEDHNAGLAMYREFGRWTASYLPAGPNDGEAFIVDTAPIPVPASMPLLAFALGILGWRRWWVQTK